jgi:hypothetical protein
VCAPRGRARLARSSCLCARDPVISVRRGLPPLPPLRSRAALPPPPRAVRHRHPSHSAGVLVLEELEHAKARGARIYAEYVGGAFTCDAHHMTEPQPEGKGVALCLNRALASAGVCVCGGGGGGRGAWLVGTLAAARGSQGWPPPRPRAACLPPLAASHRAPRAARAVPSRADQASSQLTWTTSTHTPPAHQPATWQVRVCQRMYTCCRCVCAARLHVVSNPRQRRAAPTLPQCAR